MERKIDSWGRTGEELELRKIESKLGDLWFLLFIIMILGIFSVALVTTQLSEIVTALEALAK